MYQIDVHMLLLPTDNTELFMKQYLLLTKEPVNIHIYSGIPGDIVKARSEAMKLGKAEYVGWVDSDDEIIPGSYQKLLDAIEDKDFAWMNESIIQVDRDLNVVKSKKRTTPHHMHIIKRTAINWNDVSKCTQRQPESWISKHSHNGVYVNEIGYLYRKFLYGKPK